jgi:N-acetylglutamate synthase-like GNAT family acetyltransferase
MANERKESTELILRDGQIVPVRPMRPDDAPALQRLHSRLSEQSIRLRFLGSIKRLSDRAAKYFAYVDGIDRYGLVALDPEKQDEIIGVVSFYREGRTDRAEYAALVEDRWQELGVGLGLTRRLIDEARGKGIR